MMTKKRRVFCGSAVGALMGKAGMHQLACTLVTSPGDAIDKAGRLRTVSQRNAKFYLAPMWNFASATSPADLANARNEFVPALKVLCNAPEPSAKSKQEFILADSQWLSFDNAPKSRDVTVRFASNVVVTSENLVQVMDRVTGV